MLFLFPAPPSFGGALESKVKYPGKLIGTWDGRTTGARVQIINQDRFDSTESPVKILIWNQKTKVET